MSRSTQLRAAASALALAASLGVAGCAADSEEESSGTSSTGGSETRAMTHAHGTSDLPEAPERVVVLEPVQLDTAVALGAIPVGAAVLDETSGVPTYLGDEAAGIEMVGTVAEPSVERVAALEPDLILGTESRHSALYDQLSDVAPTAFMETQTDPWQENVEFVADALGDPDGATELLDGYQDRCKEVANEHGTEGSTAQLVRPRDGILTLYGPVSFAGSTLECAGFATPERDWEDISLDISPENVLDAQADLVLVTTTDVEDTSTMPTSISDNAASFPELHLVDRSFWITGVGPLGGMTVLDDLDRILAAR